MPKRLDLAFFGGRSEVTRSDQLLSDSACTILVVNCLTYFLKGSVRPASVELIGIENVSLNTVGKVALKTPGGRVYVMDAVYHPDCPVNLFPQNTFRRLFNFEIFIGSDGIVRYLKKGEEMFTGRESENQKDVHVLDLKFVTEVEGVEKGVFPQYSFLCAYLSARSNGPKVSRRSLDEWHAVFNCACIENLKLTAKAVTGMEICGKVKEGGLQKCVVCHLGTLTKAPLTSERERAKPGEAPPMRVKTRTKPSRAGQFLVVDTQGPVNPLGQRGEKYIVTIYCLKAKYTFSFVTINKSDFVNLFIDLHSLIMNKFGKPIEVLRCDGGGEFDMNLLHAYCKSFGIYLQIVMPETQNRNEAEQRQRRLQNNTRCALIRSGFPRFIWPLAYPFCVYVSNRTATRGCKNTPYFEWTGKVPKADHLFAFGQFCFAMKRDVTLKAEGKFSPRAIAGRLVGYVGDADGYLIMIENGSLFKSQHVYFLDLVSPLLPNDVKAVPAKFNSNLPIDALFGMDNEMDLLLHHWKKDIQWNRGRRKKGWTGSRIGHPPLVSHLRAPILPVADLLSNAANLPVSDESLALPVILPLQPLPFPNGALPMQPPPLPNGALPFQLPSLQIDEVVSLSSNTSSQIQNVADAALISAPLRPILIPIMPSVPEMLPSDPAVGLLPKKAQHKQTLKKKVAIWPNGGSFSAKTSGSRIKISRTFSPIPAGNLTEPAVKPSRVSTRKKKKKMVFMSVFHFHDLPTIDEKQDIVECVDTPAFVEKPEIVEIVDTPDNAGFAELVEPSDFAKTPNFVSFQAMLPPQLEEKTEENRLKVTFEMRKLIDRFPDGIPEKAAKNSSFRQEFDDAKEKEIQGLIDKGTWEIVEKPKDPKTIYVLPCKWILSIKTDGEFVEKFKARYVVRGDKQREGIDCPKDNYSPVAELLSWRIFFQIVAKDTMSTTHIDYSQAYVNAEIDRRTHIRMPKGIKCLFDDGSKILRLLRALYGLKSAPWLWFQLLDWFFVNELGFQRLRFAQCLYILFENGILIMIIIVHVDDCGIGYIESQRTSMIIERIATKYKATILGPIRKIVGFQIGRELDGSVVMYTQDKIDEMLEKFRLTTAYHQKTPCNPHVKLSKRSKAPTKEPVEFPYSSAVGTTNYIVSVARPDCAFGQLRCAHYLANPSNEHVTAWKHLARYMSGTKMLGLKFKAKAPMILNVWTDADWGTDIDTRKAFSGIIICIGDTPIWWKSTRQTTVAESTMEAELGAAHMAIKMLRYLRDLLKEMGYPQPGPTIARQDNKGLISAVEGRNPLDSKVKHDLIRLFSLRDQYDKGTFEFLYTMSKENWADLLTKANKPAEIQRLVPKFMYKVIVETLVHF